jgi:selenocysteine lyase/cysteine desulfurase
MNASPAPAPLPSQRALFDVPADVAYFNCASIGPMLHAAREAAAAALARRAQPWTIRERDWFTDSERRRGLFARLIGADAEGVALVPAASYGLAVAAANLESRPGKNVLLIGEDFPSSVYTWRRHCERSGATLRTVSREPEQDWTAAVLEGLDAATAIVAVPNVHWTDGALLDLPRIAGAARQHGASLVVDASQSLGVMPLDLDAVQPDFLVAVGYKWLLGPFGLSYLYAAPRHREGRPLEENWLLREHSEDFSRLVDYRAAYQPGARRYDMGQRSAFELTPAAVAALQQMVEWGVARIAATLQATTAAIEQALAVLGLRVSSLPRGPHMLGLALPPLARQRAAASLAGEGVHVSLRGGAMRIAPHLHTTDEDIARLQAGLERCLRG